MFLSLVALTIATPQCTIVALPRELAGWARTAPGLDTGHATSLRSRNGAVQTQVRIRKAGTFGIAIDREGWIDVVPAGGKPLRIQSEHRGPRCSGIRKIVRYRLRPGEYRVHVTKLKAAPVRLMLVHGNAR